MKLIFPIVGQKRIEIPKTMSGFDYYMSLAPKDRPPMRTYTIKALRPEMGEVDIDFVIHGDEGPASHWAMNADIGDKIYIRSYCYLDQIATPDPSQKIEKQTGGFVWAPPKAAQNILLMADETALPAAIGIIDQLAKLPRPPIVNAYFEVPEQADCLTTARWGGLNLNWLPRDVVDKPLGAQLSDAAKIVDIPNAALIVDRQMKQVNDDEDLLWDRSSAADDSQFYAWIAGETSAIRNIRLCLTIERGLDKQYLNFMGYWRHGKTF